MSRISGQNVYVARDELAEYLPQNVFLYLARVASQHMKEKLDRRDTITPLSDAGNLYHFFGVAAEKICSQLHVKASV